MKRCPQCRRDYYDDSLIFCLDDGANLLDGPATHDQKTAILGANETGEQPTAILTNLQSEVPTLLKVEEAEQTKILPANETGKRVAQALNEVEKVTEKLPNKSPNKIWLVAVLAGILAIGGFFVYRYFTPTKQIESIAVMPFVNESKNADVEYLSDGMTETLISSLSQLPNLNVKGRSSVFRYKGKDMDTKTLGKEMGVQAVLYGRIIQRGEQLTLSLELLDAMTENVIWSSKYDRKQADVVTLQSEIARDVSNKLKTKLSGADVAKVEKNSNVNPEAYQFYLKGLFQMNRRTGESFKQAADLFKQAIEKDPKYAPAYVGLGRTLTNFPNWSLARPKDSFPQVKAAALRALELDDSLGEAHSILGRYLNEFEWDQVGAEKEFRRAIELEPNNPATNSGICDFLATQKRFDEAIAAGRRAVELDPLSKRLGLTNSLTAARRYDEAIAELKAVLQLDPNFADHYWNLGWAYIGKGSYQEAVAALQKLVELDDDVTNKSLLALAQAKAGNREEAVRLLDMLKQESSKRYVSGYAFALVYIALGKKDEALTWFEKEMEDRSSWAIWYAVDPLLDDVRDEPRFKAMLKRMNLPE